MEMPGSTNSGNGNSLRQGLSWPQGGDIVAAPIDLAIYNFKPLFEKRITGLGQTIAVVEDSNLYDPNDWTNFRAIFGLSQYQSGSLLAARAPGFVRWQKDRERS
jgi:subtilase family serine protease